ncbi:nodulin-like protein, putative [Bodo saltans]|uniref:Nodulin-like protein, putative n=1 Tax=Bodo saltans TaxID=75058 RepID=A0A0S4KMM6_BODSA|nr:nodulin-like protein, putative [Bodo saltans]|eukprot:CUM57965.1 nodulin-like protein, putative [Bodo saltans]
MLSSLLLPKLPEDRRYFLQLFISVLVSVGNGSIFCFGIFSPYMKQPAFSMSQTQINIVSTTGVVLSYFSLPTGFLFDRFGPKVTLLIGALLNLIGWLGMFTIFYDMESPILGSSTGVVSFFFGLSQWSASFYETGSVLTNLDAMSLHQGRVVIIQKTFMGLGSSIVTQLYIAFFQDRYAISTFFMFLAVFNASLGLLGAFHIRLPTPSTRVLGLNFEGSLGEGATNDEAQQEVDPLTGGSAEVETPSTTTTATATPPQTYGALSKEDDDTPPITALSHTDEHSLSRSSVTFAIDRLHTARARYERAFTFGVGLLLVVVAFVVSLTIFEAYYTIEGIWRYLMGAAMMLLLLLFAAMVPLVPLRRGAILETISSGGADKHKRKRSSSSSNEHDESTVPDAPALGSSAFPSSAGHLHLPSERIPAESLNDKPLQCNLHMLDLRLMWLVSFAVWGSGTVVSANSSQIYQSLDFDGYTSALDSVYVSIYGVASAIGRVGVGFGDGYLKDRGLNVVRLFPIAPCINALSIPLFFVLPAKGLIIAFFLSGLATGVTWGSTVLIIKSLFAPNNCGKHYNVLYTAGMLTPLIMNVALFGPLYDQQSRAQGREADHTCSGSVCVEVPLLLSLALNVAAIPCALLFARRVIANRGLS